MQGTWGVGTRLALTGPTASTSFVNRPLSSLGRESYARKAHKCNMKNGQMQHQYLLGCKKHMWVTKAVHLEYTKFTTHAVGSWTLTISVAANCSPLFSVRWRTTYIHTLPATLKTFRLRIVGKQHLNTVRSHPTVHVYTQAFKHAVLIPQSKVSTITQSTKSCTQKQGLPHHTGPN